MRTLRRLGLIAFLLLALAAAAAPAMAASTTPIQGGVYDYSPHHTMYWLQVLAFPKQHHVGVSLGSVQGCNLSPHFPGSIHLTGRNTFAASGSAPAQGRYPAEHIAISGRFVSTRKVRVTLTDCRQHTHRLTLVYKGLAGLGP